MEIIGSKRTLKAIYDEIEKLKKIDTLITNRVRATYSLKPTKDETNNAKTSSIPTPENR